MKKATLTHFYEDVKDKALGVLRFFDNDDAIFTIEPGLNDKHPRLPDGTYLAKWMHSPTYGWTWSLIGANVSQEDEPWADRDQVRIHPGNDDEESEGCVLPGLSITWDPRDQEMQVTSSKPAFEKLKAWAGGEDFILEVRSGLVSDV